MAASNELFSELARALGQPSKTFRAVQAGLAIPGQAMQGYEDVQKMKDASLERKLKPYEVYTKIADAAGRNAADSIFKQQGLTIPTMASSGTSDYASSVKDAIDNPDNYGKSELSRLGTMTTLQQNAPASFDEVDSFFKNAGRPEIGEGLISSSRKMGRTYVPKDLFDKATSLVGPKSDIAEALNKRTDLQIANSINRNVNALTSGTGALSTAGKNNLRIARIKSLLERNSPLTPSEIELVTTDFAGVIQGGVPLKDTIEGQQINTISTKIANLMKVASNNPQTFNDAGFRQRLVMLGNEMIDADNRIQEKAFDMMKANYGHLTTPDHLERVRKAIYSGEQLPIVDVQTGTTPGAANPGGAPDTAGSTGDPEADAAIQHILSSGEPEQKKQAAISAIRARSGR